MTDTYLMPLAVRLASERVRADAANTMRHDTTSDLSARLMCRVGVKDLGLVMAWVDQFAAAPSGTPSPSVEGEVVAALVAALTFVTAILDEAAFRVDYAPGSLGEIELEEAFEKSRAALSRARGE